MTFEDMEQIVTLAKTGDALHVYTRTFYGVCIRHLLSKGAKKCIMNHDAPVFYVDDTPCILDIAPPTAVIVPLARYLLNLKQHQGSALLARPDAFHGVLDQRMKKRLYQYLAQEWKELAGLDYDKQSILQIMKMYFRCRRHIKENDKSEIYCTEGTVLPMISNPIVPWKPDILVGERFPSPIHIEHLLRQGRMLCIAGDEKKRSKILQ